MNIPDRTGPEPGDLVVFRDRAEIWRKGRLLVRGPSSGIVRDLKGDRHEVQAHHISRVNPNHTRKDIR